MTKALLFDMDGTIADLYGVPNWLENLRAYNPQPYAIAEPMYDMDTLTEILNLLKSRGWKIKIVSWLSKESTPEYDKAVRQAKREWLERTGFPADEIHIIKYGTPKQRYAKEDISILIDDTADVRSSFLNYNRVSRQRMAIDANKNIMKELVDILVG